MRILITGGAGFIGSNFARYVNSVSPDTRIRILDDLSTGRRSNLEGVKAEIIAGSVADPSIVNQVVTGVDAIVHLGALGSVPRSIKNPVASHVANLTGTLHVLEAAKKYGSHLVFASSSSVYGANTKLPKSEFDWTRPMSPYAVSKLGAEAYVLAYGYSYGLSTLAFRFFNVYGPYQPADHAYAAVIPRFIDAAINHRPLTIHGDGEQSRDFTHVNTVCATIWSALETKLCLADPVNLAFGTSTTLLELVGALENQLGTSLQLQHTANRVGDVRASQADGIRLREFFPSVSPVPLEEGLATTIEWFLAQ